MDADFDRELKKIEMYYRDDGLKDQVGVFLGAVQSNVKFLLYHLRLSLNETKIWENRVSQLEKELHELRVMKGVNKDYKRIAPTKI